MDCYEFSSISRVSDTTGFHPIKSGRDYAFEPDREFVTYSQEINLGNTPLENCAALLVRTRSPAADVARSIKKTETDREHAWADTSFSSAVGLIHVVSDVEVSLSVVRPDLLLVFLQK